MSTRKNKSAPKAAAKTANIAKSKSAAKAPAAPAKRNAPLPAFDGSATHLLHRAEQCATDIFSRVAPSGLLTPRQYAILEAIEANEGLSQTGLVDLTGIDRSTLADIVRRMLDKGLVQRERTATDARAYAVNLTRKGSNLLKKMRPYAEAVDQRIIDAIPEQHRRVFLNVLNQVVESLAEEKKPSE